MEPRRTIEIRVGLPEVTGGFVAFAREARIPILLSANRFRRRKRNQHGFQRPSAQLRDLDVALDSAGFVAMQRYGGYPWTPREYVFDLVQHHAWAWWASMDFCCEPEIAADRAQVHARIQATAEHLEICRALAQEATVAPPLPVLQGWTPGDYAQSVEETARVLDGDWPALVGVGSVCRRNVDGDAGLREVVRVLNGLLPKHVGLHLFGVKSRALAAIQPFQRVASVDSQAWDYGARIHAREQNVPYTMPLRVAALQQWYDKQQRAVRMLA